MGRRHAKQKRPRSGGSARPRRDELEGTLHVIRPGAARVEASEGTFTVARGSLNGGMDGDRVRVTLKRRRGVEPQAIVRVVLERATTSFVGTFGIAGPLGVVAPLDDRIGHDFFVLPDDEGPRRHGVREGDVAVARILAYPSRHEAGVATIERSLGSPDGLDMTIERIIASHGLATRFGEAALTEARYMRADVDASLASLPARRDLRDMACVTIDPADARDFDDAMSCELTSDGGYRLGVHIADVTHYVPWGSSVDLEARARTCSAYLADRVLPMLPEQLSNDVCSLRPGEDRLAMSVLVTLDANGEVVATEACASAIRSRARLTYDEADALLGGEEPTPASPLTDEGLADMLRSLDKLAGLRREVRRRRGAVDFEGVEAKVTLDGDGVPTGVRVRSRTRATSLVEEAMLVANEAVASMLAGHEGELPTAFRVHEQPSPDALAQTLPVLRELEVLRPGEEAAVRAGDPFRIQAALARAKGTAAEIPVNAMLLRAMKRAVYLPRNDGHYALGARAYCHFTSPIRRYPDMCVHRALKVLLGVGADAGFDRRAVRAASRLMPRLCRTCSDGERVADAAARESQAVKMAELYQGRIGERCSGVVVGVERFGLFVRLDDTCAEGLLPTRALGNEWLAYDERRLMLTGEESGRVWYLGKRVAVEVSGCSPEKGRIDFRIP